MIEETGKRTLPRGVYLALATGFLLAVACTTQPGLLPDDSIPADQQRVAFQSQCAQNVITCTRRFPEAIIAVRAGLAQNVTQSNAGFLVEDPYATGAVPVQLLGSGSRLGEEATVLTYSWSYGATDDDPCTMSPGEQFSSAAETLVLLERGFHYIRLFVQNDVIFPIFESEECGVIGENVGGFHFVEVEIEVR